MGVETTEIMKIAFFQKRNNSKELADERMKNEPELDAKLYAKYLHEEEEKYIANIASIVESLGKFGSDLLKLGRFSSLSISQSHSDLICLDGVPSEYTNVLDVTIRTEGRNMLWLGTRGAYMLLNGLTKDEMKDVKIDTDNIDLFVSSLAKKFFCAIDYIAYFETTSALREVIMFDGRKVLEEETEYEYGDDDKLVQKNPDFDTKQFEDIIEENFAMSIINKDVGTY